MNKKRLLIIVMFSVFFTYCDQKHNEKNVATQKNIIKQDSLCQCGITNFYNDKFQYLMHLHLPDSSGFYKTKMMKSWDSLVLYKHVVIEYLLKFERSKVCTLYGSVLNVYPWRNKPMKDRIHALFLIEALQRNDYLFNKRGVSSALIFDDDQVNFIYDINNPALLPFLKKHDYGHMEYDSAFDSDLDEAWIVYKKWFSSDSLMVNSPIQNTNLKWFSTTMAIYEKDSSDYYNSIRDTVRLKKLGYLGLWR